MKSEKSIKKEINKTVLVVDDHKYSLLVLTKMLEQSGLEVIAAENGQAGIKAVQENEGIDLVFMDIKMPVIDGYSAMKEIKELRPDLKVIAETAYGLDGDKSLILNAGFDGYLSKPITSKSLKDVLVLYI